MYLKLNISKTGFPEDMTINWTSSNESVALVESGVVEGISSSATPITITATSNGNPTKFDTCLITVIPAAPSDTTPPIASVPEGTTLYRGQNVTTATSNEPGTIYMVSSAEVINIDAQPPDAHALKLQLLNAAVSSNNASKASVGTNISTTNLGPLGVY